MEKIIKFFDEQAAEYDNQYETVRDLRSFIFSERKKIVLQLLGNGFKRILDIGCGPGVYARELAQNCGELYGVDASSEMVALAEKRCPPNARFLRGDIENLGFQDGFFDGVVCVGVLEYLDDAESGIKEVARVTADGGLAIFTAPNASSVLNQLDYLVRILIRPCCRLPGIDVRKSFLNYRFRPRLFSKDRLQRLLAKHGFEITQVRFHIFRLSFLNRIAPRLSLQVAQKMNFVSSRFVGINCVIRAVKR